MRKITFLAAILMAGITLNAQDGVLDNTFGTSGRTLTDVNNTYDEARNIVVQTDGKIVVGGLSGGGSGEDFLLIRYNPDGTLDNSFGIAGKVVTNVSAGNDVIRGMALQSDGKIVVVGYAGLTNEFLSIARYKTNGTLDSTFATNGLDSLLIYDNPGSDRTVPNDLLIQPDGKIVVVGFTKNSGGVLNSMIVRYNSNGTLDSSFGIGGKLVTPLGTDDAEWEGVAIQTDGKLVACGHYKVVTGYVMAMARYNQFGLDNSFGTNGIITKAIGQGENKFLSLAIQADTKIVVGGVTPNNNDLDFAVLRYLSDGTLDNSFGTAGVVTTEMGNNVDDYLTQLILQPDGKILTSGASFNSSSDFVMARYDANGTLDNTFGLSANGIVMGNHGSIDEIAFGVGLQSDGKIVLAGVFNFDVFVDRYNNTIVGVEEIEFSEELKLYPNPASDRIYFDVERSVDVQIIDLSGKIVLSQNAVKQINISNLLKGLYICKVIGKDKIITQRFIKE